MSVADVSPAAPLQRVESPPSDRTAILIASFIFTTLSLYAALASQGFLEADGCTHYLYSRYALVQHHYLINVWGRPVCTGVYAIPAYFTGRIGVRITSLLIALAIANATYHIAKLQNYPRPAFAFIFVLAQPLVFFHSFAELTELPFALLIATAFLAYQQKRWWEFALIVGVTPLSRPEGFGFVLLAFIALIAHRRFYWIPLLLLPVLLWDWGGWEFYGRPGPWYTWLKANWPYAADSLYAKGYLLHYVALLPAVTSPLIFPAFLIGLYLIAHQIYRAIRVNAPHPISDPEAARSPSPILDYGIADYPEKTAHDDDAIARQRNEFLIALIPFGILAVHSYLHWRGKMASNGELRYMLIVAPFWSLLAARGWQWLTVNLQWRTPLRYAGIAALLPMLANHAYTVIPLKYEPDVAEAQVIANWYQQSDLHNRYPQIINSHPALWYFLDKDPNSGLQWTRDAITHPQGGTIVFWNNIYGVLNADQSRSIRLTEISNHAWRRIPLPPELGDVQNWAIFVSPNDLHGRATPPD